MKLSCKLFLSNENGPTFTSINHLYMNTHPLNQLRSLFLILFAASVCLPCAGATIRTVTSLGDNGAGTLRDTIAASASGDTINFAVTGTISLTTAELVVANNLTITGPGAG